MLAGTNWRAAPVAGQPRRRQRTHRDVHRDRVNGTTGCNSFGGGYTYADGGVAIGELRMTIMGCIGPIGDVEGRFTQAMTAATTATTD